MIADRTMWRGALLVAAVAAAIRLGWVAFSHVTPISDFAGYDALAWQWLRHGGYYGAIRTPGYPAVLAAVYAVAGHHVRAVGLLQALAGGVNAGLLVLLARRFLSPGAALLVGLLYALSPTAIVYVPVLANETLTLTLLLSGLLLLGASEEPERKARYVLAAAAGLAFGLMVLTRSGSALFLPGLCVLALYSPPRRAWHARLGLVVIAATALVLGPWLIRNVRAGYGLKLSTAGGVTLWEGNNDQATLRGKTSPSLDLGGLSQREEDDYYEATALHWIRTHPKRYLLLSGARAFHLLGIEPDSWAARWLVPTRENDEATVAYFDLMNRRGVRVDRSLAVQGKSLLLHNRHLLRWLRLPLLPFLLAGLLLWLWRFRTSAPVLLPVLSYLGALALTTGHPRYRELSDPLLLLPAVSLMAAIVASLMARARRYAVALDATLPQE